jgi:hypothetical protein
VSPGAVTAPSYDDQHATSAASGQAQHLPFELDIPPKPVGCRCQATSKVFTGALRGDTEDFLLWLEQYQSTSSNA